MQLYLHYTELFEIEMFLALKLYLHYTELFEIEMFLALKLYLHYTELFEIEMFWYFTVHKRKKTILILNCIIWNRTIYKYENGFGIK